MNNRWSSCEGPFVLYPSRVEWFRLLARRRHDSSRDAEACQIDLIAMRVSGRRNASAVATERRERRQQQQQQQQYLAAVEQLMVELIDCRRGTGRPETMRQRSRAAVRTTARFTGSRSHPNERNATSRHAGGQPNDHSAVV
jgi:hypothetical protein